MNYNARYILNDFARSTLIYIKSSPIFFLSRRIHVSKSKKIPGFSGAQPHHWQNRRKRAGTIVTEESFGRSDINRDRSREEVSRDHQQHPRLFYPAGRDIRFRWLGNGPDRSWLIEGIVLVPCSPAETPQVEGDENSMTNRATRPAQDAHVARDSLPTPSNNNLSSIVRSPIDNSSPRTLDSTRPPAYLAARKNPSCYISRPVHTPWSPRRSLSEWTSGCGLWPVSRGFIVNRRCTPVLVCQTLWEWIFRISEVSFETSEFFLFKTLL